MKCSHSFNLVASFAALLLLVSTAWSQPYADATGLTALQAAITNLSGSGMRAAIVEAPYNGTTNFEADPSIVGQPAGRFTYHSSAGSAASYPNKVGGFSGHADDSANVICSPFFHGFATNLAHLDVIEAGYFYYRCVSVSGGPAFCVPVANQSFTFGALTAQNQRLVDSQFDNYSLQNNMLFISAAGNGGSVAAPGTSYNGIDVAAYTSSGASSGIGPTIDNGRCKPDLAGINVDTSGACPEVSGAAVLMFQAGFRGDGGSDTKAAGDMRTVKALLLNGAVKPPGWTNSNSSPLDARYGAGILNILNSYEQLSGGQHPYIATDTVALNAAHPPTGAAGTVPTLSGWNFATNVSSATADAIHHYYFNVSNRVATVKFSAAATLVWNRQVNQSTINNLDLYLYNCANSNLVLCSTSAVDNVEHIWTTNLAQGRYDLQVLKKGGAFVSAAEPYALAWEFVPPPLLAPAGGTNTAQ